MTTLAMQHGYIVLGRLQAVVFADIGRLTDEAEEAIHDYVAALSDTEIFQLVWTTEGIDGDLLPGGDLDEAANGGVRVAVCLLGELLIRQAILERGGYFEDRRQRMMAAKARLGR